MKNKVMQVVLLAAVGLIAVAAKAVENPAMMEPVKSVYDHYLKIQESLAKDSLDGVSENATMITKAIRGDDMKMLSLKVADQAEALAKAKDLESARAAFMPLSQSLIDYLAANKITGQFVQVYCPMAKASWLQADTKIKNPYMGKMMSGCGQIIKGNKLQKHGAAAGGMKMADGCCKF